MKQITVMGTGEQTDNELFFMIKKIAEKLKLEAEITQSTDIVEMLNIGIMYGPAIIIDGEILHSGGMPSELEIIDWLTLNS